MRQRQTEYQITITIQISCYFYDFFLKTRCNLFACIKIQLISIRLCIVINKRFIVPKKK